MSVTMDIKFDPASFNNLRRSIEHRTKVLNESTAKTITKASLKVLVSLRAAAKQSPKLRQIVDNPKLAELTSYTVSFDKNGKQRNRKKVARNGFAPFAVEIWRNGVKSVVPAFGAKTKSEVQELPLAKIKKQGLAKSSITWMMGKLGGPSSAKQKEIQGVASVVTQHQGRMKYNRTIRVIMENKLLYIMSALQGGKHDVTQALDNAAKMLRSDTQRALDRMAKSHE